MLKGTGRVPRCEAGRARSRRRGALRLPRTRSRGSEVGPGRARWGALHRHLLVRRRCLMDRCFCSSAGHRPPDRREPENRSTGRSGFRSVGPENQQKLSNKEQVHPSGAGVDPPRVFFHLHPIYPDGVHCRSLRLGPTRTARADGLWPSTEPAGLVKGEIPEHRVQRDLILVGRRGWYPLGQLEEELDPVTRTGDQVVEIGRASCRERV